MNVKSYANPTVNLATGLLLSLAVFLGSARSALGATRVWTGGSGSSSDWNYNWNWDGHILPVAGDDLVFPAGASRRVNNNTYTGRSFRSITFLSTGYTLRGENIVLTEGITANFSGASNTVELDIALAADQTFTCNISSGILFVNGNINLGSHRLTTFGAGAVHLGGVISGSGGVTKNGSGTHWLDGSLVNTYSGQTRVLRGTLELAKTSRDAIRNGSLVIGDNVGDAESAVVHELHKWQIGMIPITINTDGLLDVGDFEDTVGAITFNGGKARSSATGLLQLGGNLTVNASTAKAYLEGNVYVGSGTRIFDVGEAAGGYDLTVTAVLSGGGLAKTGLGSMALYDANTYTGETTVEQGLLYVRDNNSLGTTDGGTTVNGTGVIRLIGVDVGLEPLTLDRPSSYALNAFDSCSWAGDVVLSEDAVLWTSGSMEFSGAISGPGGLSISGGTFRLSGDGNSYTGDTVVNVGVLELAGVRVIRYGTLVIGDGAGARESVVVRFLQSLPIHFAADVVIKADGLLDFNDHADDLGYVLFDRGQLKTGTGRFNVRGNVGVIESFNTNWVATISGNVDLGISQRTFDIDTATVLYLNAQTSGSGGIAKTGGGQLYLTSSNSYTGATTINEGRLYADNDHSLGTTDGGTTVADGTALVLRYGANVGNEALALSGLGQSNLGALASIYGSSGWAGPITVAGATRLTTLQSGDTLDLSGAIGGSGNVTLEGGGTVAYSGSGANTYSGDTYVNSGTLSLEKTVRNISIPGNLYIGNGVGGADADVVRLVNTFQIPSSTRITIAGSGLFDLGNLLERFGSLAGSGHVDMGTGGIDVGVDSSSSVFSGLVEGTGELRKSGSGTFELSGNNTYSGDTRVYAGTLLVNGLQPGSDVVVSSPGTLGGIGTVGAISSQGTVAPGTSAGQLGSASATLQSSSAFDVELDGYTLVDYDQLDVNGTATIDNANLSIDWGFVPAVGDSFTILDNDGADAVAGTFNGLAEGASVVAGNVTLQISYTGGTGNDVVLAATDVTELEPLAITSIDIAGGDVHLEWIGGVPPYVVEKKTSLTNGTWTAEIAPTRNMATALPSDTTNGFYRVTGGN